jgi:fatty-acyl-CoA synthase
MTVTLYEQLLGARALFGDRPAMTFWRRGGRDVVVYTHAELFEQARSIGRRLAARGVGHGSLVGILVSSQEQQVLHYLAALSIGAVPAILTPPNRKLHPEYYAQTTNAVLARCGFEALVTDLEQVGDGVRVLSPTSCEPRDDDLPVAAHADRGAARPPDASFIQFSSGTTGVKRGVSIRDEAVLAQLSSYGQAIGLGPDDVIVSWLPLYHDMGFIACFHLPLVHGAHTVMLDPIEWVTDPGSYLRAVSAYAGTVSWHPNFAFAFMAERIRGRTVAEVDLSSLRALVNCSEPVTWASQAAFAERFADRGLAPDVFRGCYAMAETTFALTDGVATDDDYLDVRGPTTGVSAAGAAGYVSVGRPLPGAEVRIADIGDGSHLDDREVGEIWVRSPFTFDGYHNDPDATDRAFVDGWYRTGDLGYRVGDALFVSGRLKDVLIVGGVNVYPQDIEELVGRVDGIQPGRVVAVSAFDPRLQTERITILAEPTSPDGDSTGAARAERQVLQEVRQRVLAAFQIANFEVRLVPPGWLVKSTSGKLARSANRARWLALVSSSPAPDK